MSTLNKISLQINIVDVGHKLLEQATVHIVGSQPSPIVAGRSLVPGVRLGKLPIRVEACGMACAEFVFEVTAVSQTVDVVLGEPGLPTFRRRGIPVPFCSPEDQLGVIT